MTVQPVLINGTWRAADAAGMFRAENPRTQQLLPDEYPVSSWRDCDAALNAAVAAAESLRRLPGRRIAAFLEKYADRLDAQRETLAELAATETGLPLSPRLRDAELPRTTDQLRQAAAAARDASWCLATIDIKAGVRSCYAAIGPVCVFGPNNFPLAFNGVSGGDFAAAIAAGNPVIAKAHSAHPGTSRMLAQLAHSAMQETDMPPGTVQLLYRLSHADGARLVADPRLGATGYTGSRAAGLRLKAAADSAGKPIYLELSSINPVVILPGAIIERADEIAEQFTTSCLTGAGQFCTNPGLVMLLDGDATEDLVRRVARRFQEAPVGTLLSRAVADSLGENISRLIAAGAEVVAGNQPGGGQGFSHANTLLRTTGQRFLASASALQTEAFGNASLLVVARDIKEVCQMIDRLEGNLTGTIYSARDGRDDRAVDEIAPLLRRRVGRLLNDKMPTGVLVTPAMNHGGPFPATGHPGFTAVGIPAALRRFAMLQCYDNVRHDRLPPVLQDKNLTRQTWRLIDGTWSQGDVSP
jgi:NADP-dependent aldehyde dehydrogenase